jgi:hypothetical protein
VDPVALSTAPAAASPPKARPWDHALAAGQEIRKAFAAIMPPEVHEHARTAGREIRSGFAAMMPPECQEHGRAAGREALLAARTVIDGALERLAEKPRT